MLLDNFLHSFWLARGVRDSTAEKTKTLTVVSILISKEVEDVVTGAAISPFERVDWRVDWDVRRSDGLSTWHSWWRSLIDWVSWATLNCNSVVHQVVLLTKELSYCLTLVHTFLSLIR